MGTIGPHEGKEFELFSKEKKDLILFGEDGLPENYLQLVKSVGAKQYAFKIGELKGFIFYREGFESQAKRLAQLVKASMSKPSKPAEVEREIGRLLSYAENDIEAYIQSLKQRSCTP